MTTDNSSIAQQPEKPADRVSQEVAVLLAAIEQEEVPDRLLSLALELQKALHQKLDESPAQTHSDNSAEAV